VYAVQFGPTAEKPALIDKALALDATNFNEAEKIMRQLLVNWKKDTTAKAGETMKALVAAYPKTPQALEWASLHAAWTDKNVDDALVYAQKLAKMSPKFAPNYNTIGYLSMQKKDMEKAKAAFEKYIALAPKEPNAYDSMGEFYMTTKDYAKSAEYYDKAAALGQASAKERADKARAMIK
jgi:tetratricopeptide (TPR) repeat protein